MQGVWVARMETEHYEWTAVGKTEEEARNAIAKEWNEGRGSNYRTEMTKDELEECYGIYCDFIKFGECEWH
jgi:hypothetical protein